MEEKNIEIIQEDIKLKKKDSLEILPEHDSPALETTTLEEDESGKDKISTEVIKALSFKKSSPLELAKFFEVPGEHITSVFGVSVGEIRDKKSKPISLTSHEQKLIRIISRLASRQMKNERVLSYLGEVNEGNVISTFLKFTFKTADIARRMTSSKKRPQGRTHEDARNKVVERITDLESKKQLFKMDVIIEGKETSVTVWEPFIRFGRRYFIGDEEKMKNDMITIEVHRLFFQALPNSYVPETDKLDIIWLNTDTFVTLLTQVENLWNTVLASVNQVEQEISKSYQGKKRKGSMFNAIKEAVHEKSLRDIKIESIIQKKDNEVSSSREQERRFKTELQESLEALVEYGIITNESFIDWKNEKIWLLFDTKFYKKEEETGVSILKEGTIE